MGYRLKEGGGYISADKGVLVDFGDDEYYWIHFKSKNDYEKILGIIKNQYKEIEPIAIDDGKHYKLSSKCLIIEQGFSTEYEGIFTLYVSSFQRQKKMSKINKK